ncbi:hypothetical protein CEXT_736661 [Caerostris extrusa]|uniref:Uncharacterized protein n=1 Tax=Caerostris extrusa TaxID=172846 RepID=A0AAV4QC98_CAEEX|nr:hypothetical protein CEXT_736661 [Caerostris extrusa]
MTLNEKVFTSLSCNCPEIDERSSKVKARGTGLESFAREMAINIMKDDENCADYHDDDDLAMTLNERSLLPLSCNCLEIDEWSLKVKARGTGLESFAREIAINITKDDENCAYYHDDDDSV